MVSWRIAALTLAMSALTPAVGAAADPAGQISETALSATSSPGWIAPGDDGNLWFTDRGTTKAIGRVDPSSGVIADFSNGLNSGSAPYWIAPGADGNLWFTDIGKPPAIGRIDPATGQITEFSNGLNRGSYPFAIAPGADGDMWFTDTGNQPAIGRIDPATGQITEFSTGLNQLSSPLAIAPGADGSVWFTDRGSMSAIGRIDPATGQIKEFSNGLQQGSYLIGIAPGTDGDLWFTDEGTPGAGVAGAIGRIDPATHQITEFSNGLNQGSAPYAIAPGADGSMWFTDWGNTSAIGRIDPATGQITEFSDGVDAHSKLFAIAPGADGNLWFSDIGTTAIGGVGTGAPAAVQSPPTLSGPGRAGAPESCGSGQFATWAGVTPTASLYPFDGYHWMRDGAPIAGQTAQTYTPGPDDVGHELACRIVVTYPLPLLLTVPATSAAITVQPPAAPPQTVITAGPSGTTSDASPRFQFTSDDPAATFECALDSGPFVPCVSPYTAGPLADGAHTFTVRAIDTAGPDSSPPTRTFTVQATGAGGSVPPTTTTTAGATGSPLGVGPPTPITAISSRPPAQTPDQVVRFTFTGKQPSQIDPYSGITFQCQLDGGPFTPCQPPYTSPTLALGSHYFQVRAVTAGGTVDPNPAAWAFRITQPLAETHTYRCPLEDVADWQPSFNSAGWPLPPPGGHLDPEAPTSRHYWWACNFPGIVCPAASACLFDLSVDQHDDSLYYNHDVHLQQIAETVPGHSAFQDKLYCFSPPLTTPYNPDYSVRAYRYPGPSNAGHACDAEGSLGLIGAATDVHGAFRCLGYLQASHADPYNHVGDGYEQNAHMGCEITTTIQRHVTELGELVTNSPQLGPKLLVISASPGTIYLSGTVHAAHLSRKARTAPPRLVPVRVAMRAGAVRIPLKLNAAARRLERGNRLTLTLTTTYQPATGEAITRVTTITIPRTRATR